MDKWNSYTQLAALVARAQGGDRAAFEKLYQITAQAQYFTILAKTNPEIAPDLLQEVYCIAWKNIATVTPRLFIGYLNGVTRNVCLRYYERKGRATDVPASPDELEAAERERPDGSEGGEHTADPAATIAGRDEHRRLARALRDELDDDEREVVLMRFYQEMSLEAIAENRGVSVSTVQRTIKRALAKLRQVMVVLPIGPALAPALQRAVERTAAPGALPRRGGRRRTGADRLVQAVAAAAVLGVVGSLGFVAAEHLKAPEPQIIYEEEVPAAEPAGAEPGADGAADTEPPQLVEMRTDRGATLLRFADASGVADAVLTCDDGTEYRAEAVVEMRGDAVAEEAGEEGGVADGERGAADAPDGGVGADEERSDGTERTVTEFRFRVPSGTYHLIATDHQGNTTTGRITIDFPSSTPEPYIAAK